MSIRFSSKDLLLLLGILVAVIITLTTVVYRETALEKETSAPKKSSLNTGPKVMIEKLLGRAAKSVHFSGSR
jgi:hypothetical protein